MERQLPDQGEEVKRDKVRVKKHRCQVCGAYGVTQIHHIFGGALRKISEKHDFVIELCPACHQKAHTDGDFSFCLKHDAQLDWLWSGHTMAEWMEMMHRSWVYLREVQKPRKPREIPADGPGRFDDEEDHEEGSMGNSSGGNRDDTERSKGMMPYYGGKYGTN